MASIQDITSKMDEAKMLMIKSSNVDERKAWREELLALRGELKKAQGAEIAARDAAMKETIRETEEEKKENQAQFSSQVSERPVSRRMRLVGSAANILQADLEPKS